MQPKQPNQNNSQRPKPANNNSGSNGGSGRNASRGAAIRAQRRASDDATRTLNQYVDMPNQSDDKPRANFIDDSARLKIIGLGGMDGGGSKNMILVEYMNDAVIMD